MASLLSASKEFAAQHGFAVHAKGSTYFPKPVVPTGGAAGTSTTSSAGQAAEEQDNAHTSSGGADLDRMRMGQIQCHHYGGKRSHTPVVDAQKQRTKPTQKLGCCFHINFRVTELGGRPEVGFLLAKRGEGALSYNLAHVGHECNAANERYINRSIPEEAKEMVQRFVRCNAPMIMMRHYLRQNFPDSNFTNKDLHNYVQTCRGDSAADAQDLLQTLFTQQKSDPMMTVKTLTDADGALKVLN